MVSYLLSTHVVLDKPVTAAFSISRRQKSIALVPIKPEDQK